MARGNDADFVSTFVRTLDWADRCLLMLFYAEGLSTNEISQVLDQPEFKIVERLRGLRETVKGALERYALA